jgi:hypothetical protein
MSNAEVMIEARMIKVAFSMRLNPIRQEKLPKIIMHFTNVIEPVNWQHETKEHVANSRRSYAG